MFDQFFVLNSYLPSSFDTGMIYESTKPPIHSDIINVHILTGTINFRTESEPELAWQLSDYRKLGIEILSGKDKLFLFESLCIDTSLKQDLKKYLYLPGYEYCSFSKVPINLVKDLISSIFEHTDKKDIKIGGFCKRCGAYDQYAPLDKNGECYCYRCFTF